jgi:hypothetical protein
MYVLHKFLQSDDVKVNVGDFSLKEHFLNSYYEGVSITRAIIRGEGCQYTQWLAPPRDGTNSAYMLLLKSFDAKDLLEEIARLMALDLAPYWDCPRITKKYLKSGEESIRTNAFKCAEKERKKHVLAKPKTYGEYLNYGNQPASLNKQASWLAIKAMTPFESSYESLHCLNIYLEALNMIPGGGSPPFKEEDYENLLIGMINSKT